MPNAPQTIRLELSAVPPDNASTVRAALLPDIEEALREAGRGDLLDRGELTVTIRQTFPTDPITVAIVVALTKMATDTYNAIILPRLKQRFGVKETPEPDRPAPGT